MLKNKLVVMKVQALSSLEPPLKYNQSQISLMNQASYDLLKSLRVTEMLYSFRLVLEGIAGK